jgi:hypothetical protein
MRRRLWQGAGRAASVGTFRKLGREYLCQAFAEVKLRIASASVQRFHALAQRSETVPIKQSFGQGLVKSNEA